MCDTYMAKCKECNNEIPIHLGDYATEREEIECYCGVHIPPTNCRIYVSKNASGSNPLKYPRKMRIGIRALTQNAKNNIEINHPNLDSDFTVVDI